jgi:hypothetical protein
MGRPGAPACTTSTTPRTHGLRGDPPGVDAQNPPEYAGPGSGPEAAAAQKQAFPDLQPLLVNQPANLVFAAARDVVAEKGWTLVDAN